MLKKLFLLLAGSTALSLIAAPLPDKEAAAYLKQLKEKTPVYQHRSGRTAIFARSQLKYDLSRSDYPHKWFDRPLMQDTSYQKTASRADEYINSRTWGKMADCVSYYKMTGFAFFPQSSRRDGLYQTVLMTGPKVQLLNELVGIRKGMKFSTVDPVIEKALACPNSYRIDGKLVLTSYPGTDDGKTWQALGKYLRDKYGDKFLLMPYFGMPRWLRAKTELSVADVKQMQQAIRNFLRCVDGFYYNDPQLNGLRRFDRTFARDVMQILIHAVLAEKEFQNRYLAYGTKVGHENYYAKGSFTHDCGGTDMLRGSVESAVLAGADIINLVEWDEENENTHFRPTLLNSFSTGRIIRALSEKANGEKPSMIPGDDPAIPNVILSYRRIFVAGQTLEFELVNVPDGTAECSEYPVELVLRDQNGKQIKSFTGKLDTAKLSELRFNVPAAEVLNSHILIPELTVNGKKFDRGFMPIEMRGNWNYDFHWVKQPLRDLGDMTMTLKLGEVRKDGFVELSGSVDSQVPLRSVEVLCSGDPVYMHGSDPQLTETAGRVVFSILCNAVPKENLRWTGSILLKDATGAAFATDVNIRGGKPGKDGWHFKQGAIPNNFNGMVLRCAMDRASAEKAYFDVDLRLEKKGVKLQVFKGKLRIADLLEKRIYAVSGPALSSLVFRHTGIPVNLPAPVNSKHADFRFFADPLMPQSAFVIEAVDARYRTFRSLPVTLWKPAGKTAKFSAVDVHSGKPITVEADQALLNPVQFQIAPVHGCAVATSAGNELSGLMSGLSPLLNQLRALGESAYGNILIDELRKMHKDNKESAAPKYVKLEDGKWAWQFSGKENIAFPSAVLYPYSGFRLIMKLRPSGNPKEYSILSSGNGGMTLGIRGGRLTVSYYLAHSGSRIFTSVLSLTGGEWNTLVLERDMKTLTLSVNGKKQSFPCKDHTFFNSPFSLGMALGGTGFAGEISELTLEPR